MKPTWSPERTQHLEKRAGRFRKRGAWANAEKCYREILRLNPNHFEAANDLGVTLVSAGQPQRAADYFYRAAQLRPWLPDVWMNLARAYQISGDLPNALKACETAVQRGPTHVEALKGLYWLYERSGRIEDALATAKRLLEVEDIGETRCAIGAYQITLGDYENGLDGYEHRWALASMQKFKVDLPQPRWTGTEDLRGKSILVWPEQGFGDKIQNARYIPRLKALGAEVIVASPKVLAPLFRHWVPGVDDVLQAPAPLVLTDYQIPMFSLPHAFRYRGEPTAPYLQKPDNLDLTAFDRSLGPHPRVGLCWGGRPEHHDDANRSIPWEHFSKALPPGGRYVCLRPVIKPAEATWFPGVVPKLDNFAETAALIWCLDLVITVDTAVAHLAGAMGKPVWILLPYVPDWRWGMHGTTTPLYPSARLYRQPKPGDWQTVLARIAGDLAGVALNAAA